MDKKSKAQAFAKRWNGQFFNYRQGLHSSIEYSNKESRNFRPEDSNDTIKKIIINETAVRELGIPSPVVGEQIVWSENRPEGQISYATIVGVVNDFHFTSMREEIRPFIFINGSNREWKLNIKMSSTNLSRTLSSIQQVWNSHVKIRPFQYTFLDETYENLYKSEMNFKTIFSYITFIAVFISCLGLLALSSFVTEQRIKEIGIRKVLGASVFNIASMLCKEFLQLVVIACAVAFPIALLIMNYWLQDFAYRIKFSAWMFTAAGLSAIIITLVTVCFHTLKAAYSNPAEILKSE